MLNQEQSETWKASKTTLTEQLSVFFNRDLDKVKKLAESSGFASWFANQSSSLKERKVLLTTSWRCDMCLPHGTYPEISIADTHRYGGIVIVMSPDIFDYFKKYGLHYVEQILYGIIQDCVNNESDRKYFISYVATSYNKSFVTGQIEKLNI